MPAFETMDRNQHAVLWQRKTLNGRPASTRHGKPLVNTPADVMVQWDDSYTQGRDAKGNKVDADGTIFWTGPVAIGSMFWLGTIQQATSQALDAGSAIELLEVVYVNITPDLKGRVASYEYGVKRFTDQIPTN